MLQSLKTGWALLQADKRGVTAVEYAVIAAVIVGTVATAFGTLGTKISTLMSGIAFP